MNQLPNPVYYYQRPFSTAVLPNGTGILYSAGGAYVISEPRILRIMEKCFRATGATISARDLDEEIRHHGLNPGDVRKFLTDETKILVYSGDTGKPFGINQVRVLFAEEELSKIVANEIKKYTTIDTIAAKDLETPLKSRTLLVIAQERYDPTTIRRAYRSNFHSQNVAIATAYFMHDMFVIDSIYIPSKRTPCHFCHLERWAETSSNRKYRSSSSWYAFYRLTMDESWPISLSLPIRNLERNVATFFLLKRILPYFLCDSEPVAIDDMHSYLHFRLTTGERLTDLVPHAKSCGCVNGIF